MKLQKITDFICISYVNILIFHVDRFSHFEIGLGNAGLAKENIEQANPGDGQAFDINGLW